MVFAALGGEEEVCCCEEKPEAPRVGGRSASERNARGYAEAHWAHHDCHEDRTGGCALDGCRTGISTLVSVSSESPTSLSDGPDDVSSLPRFVASFRSVLMLVSSSRADRDMEYIS